MVKEEKEVVVSYVYLYQGSIFGRYLTKIGMSDNPYHRAKDYAGLPFKGRMKLYLRVTDKSVRQLERSLHKQFSRNRLNGEWFDLAKGIHEEIREQYKDVAVDPHNEDYVLRMVAEDE